MTITDETTILDTFEVEAISCEKTDPDCDSQAHWLAIWETACSHTDTAYCELHRTWILTHESFPDFYCGKCDPITVIRKLKRIVPL